MTNHITNLRELHNGFHVTYGNGDAITWMKRLADNGAYKSQAEWLGCFPDNAGLSMPSTHHYTRLIVGLRAFDPKQKHAETRALTATMRESFTRTVMTATMLDYRTSSVTHMTKRSSSRHEVNPLLGVNGYICDSVDTTVKDDIFIRDVLGMPSKEAHTSFRWLTGLDSYLWRRIQLLEHEKEEEYYDKEPEKVRGMSALIWKPVRFSTSFAFCILGFEGMGVVQPIEESEQAM